MQFFSPSHHIRCKWKWTKQEYECRCDGAKKNQRYARHSRAIDGRQIVWKTRRQRQTFAFVKLTNYIVQNMAIAIQSSRLLFLCLLLFLIFSSNRAQMNERTLSMQQLTMKKPNIKSFNSRSHTLLTFVVCTYSEAIWIFNIRAAHKCSQPRTTNDKSTQ